jgi:hypothetical protein
MNNMTLVLITLLLYEKYDFNMNKLTLMWITGL